MAGDAKHVRGLPIQCVERCEIKSIRVQNNLQAVSLTALKAQLASAYLLCRVFSEGLSASATKAHSQRGYCSIRFSLDVNVGKLL
jgi:hypothetical protein